MSFLRKNKPAERKKSWQVDAEDDGPSESFLALKAELEEREKLAKENAERAAAEAEQAKRAAELAEEDRKAQEIAAAGDETSAAAHANPEDEHLTVIVTNFSHKTRVHDLKQHFMQFGDVCEVAIVAKQAFVSYDRPREASDALLDGASVHLMGAKLRVEYAPTTYKPNPGIRGANRWHRDEALRKKEAYRTEHEVRQQMADERRAREKEERRFAKEREDRRAAERAEREQARRQGDGRGNRDDRNRGQGDGNRGNRSRSRSRSPQNRRYDERRDREDRRGQDDRRQRGAYHEDPRGRSSGPGSGQRPRGDSLGDRGPRGQAGGWQTGGPANVGNQGPPMAHDRLDAPRFGSGAPPYQAPGPGGRI
mmetsp:Transcript_69865/g.157910  ORF Transcript_69865/g.157910 Transcript_69865/m.157910 type:complete len:366 (-) Transcript_69865:326-1423(-)